VERNPELIEAFYTGYRLAVERINATPREQLLTPAIDAALSLFFPGSPREAIPAEVIDSIAIPRFHAPTTLDREDFDAVAAWMVSRGYIDSAPSYDDLADARFLDD
jgi:hypothetical protein